MRTPGNPETHFTGAAHAETAAIGELVRTTPTAIESYSLVNPVAANMAGLSNIPSAVVFDGTHFVGIPTSGGVSTSHYSADGGLSWSNGGNAPAQWTGSFETNGNGVIMSSVSVSGTTLLRTTDHGANWVSVGTLPASGVWTITYCGGTTWRAVPNFSSNLSAVSTDDGATWSAGPNLPATAASWRTCYGKGRWIVGQAGLSWMSLNDGVTWLSGSTAHGAGIAAFFYFPRIDMFVASADNTNSSCSFSYDGLTWFARMTIGSANIKRAWVVNGYLMEAPDDFLLAIRDDTTGALYRVLSGQRNPVLGNVMNVAAYGNGNYFFNDTANNATVATGIIPVYSGVTS